MNVRTIVKDALMMLGAGWVLRTSMDTLLMRCGVCLLSLGVIGNAPGQTPIPDTNLASGGTPSTEVVLIGALHDFHRNNPHYTLEVLRGLIVSCKPQAICSGIC